MNRLHLPRRRAPLSPTHSVPPCRRVPTLAALTLVAIASLVSCRTPAPGVPLPADDPRPALMLARMQAGALTRRALRAKTRLSLESPDLRFDRPQRMAIQRPAQLRVEVLGLFDQLAAVVVTDGADYQLYDAREGRLEEGRVTPDLLWQVARVDLEPAEAVSLLLGTPPPSPSGLAVAAPRVFPDGAVSFERRDADGVLRERHRFDAAGALRESERFDARARTLWSARFDDYRAVEGAAGRALDFAFEVDLRFPRVDARVRLRFDRVELVDSLPEELFVLRLPERRSRSDATSAESRAASPVTVSPTSGSRVIASQVIASRESVSRASGPPRRVSH